MSKSNKIRYVIMFNNSLGCQSTKWIPLTWYYTYKEAAEEFIRQFNNMELDNDGLYKIKKIEVE